MQRRGCPGQLYLESEIGQLCGLVGIQMVFAPWEDRLFLAADCLEFLEWLCLQGTEGLCYTVVGCASDDCATLFLVYLG